MHKVKKELEELVCKLGECTGEGIEATIKPVRKIIKLLIIVFSLIIVLIIITFSLITYSITKANPVCIYKQRIVTKYIDTNMGDSIETYEYLYDKKKGKEVCSYYRKYENHKHYYKTICKLSNSY